MYIGLVLFYPFCLFFLTLIGMIMYFASSGKAIGVSKPDAYVVILSFVVCSVWVFL